MINSINHSPLFRLFKRPSYLFLLAVCILLTTLVSPQRVSAQLKKNQAYGAYLFVYFTGNDKTEEAIRFAVSNDGYNYLALNQNQPVIDSKKISETGGVRDPHILRGADGKSFYMVATDMVSAKGWNSNRGMVLLKSKDLIHWSSSVLNFQKLFSGQDSLLRVWAPETIYDSKQKKYLVYFSLKYGNQPDKIYYAYANKDFTGLEGTPKQLFYSPDNAACIDADIVEKDGKYYLFFKTEDRLPGIKIAISDKLTGGYRLQSDQYVQQTKKPVEGAGTFKLNDGSGYILMYDMYTSGRYQFTKSTDLKNFRVIDQQVSMNFNPRHGTVMPITKAEEARLVSKWMSPNDIIQSVNEKSLKKNNVVFDSVGKKLYLPAIPGTNLKDFKPKFANFAGASVTAEIPVNFAKGPVNYTVKIAGHAPVQFQAIVVQNHNPVLAGYYADPEILYSKKTNKFYIYPTSDGFPGWGGAYFKAFSSPDLVHWKDNGVILDLEKDVSWAKRNAWAPCVIERKINGQFKYFFYFCAAQKIGVAVADDPLGPFVDSGKPVIDHLPDGVNGGQQIDPAVFADFKSGKFYLYWGNGYMAGAELNDDMLSVKPATTVVLTPDQTFREATYVFYRNGKYYFNWSEDDTGSENYKVRYGIADGPLSKINVPANNIVIQKDKSSGIYATGHNAILQIPGKDEWYIVYHRFTYPKGITIGGAAAWSREVCIDKLTFNSDGTIKEVKPTLTGIAPVSVGGNVNY